MAGIPITLQYAVVGVAVVLSLWVVLGQQMPGVVRALRVAIARRLLRDGSGWAMRMSRAIAPKGPVSNACGGCNGCGSPASAPDADDAGGRLRPQ